MNLGPCLENRFYDIPNVKTRLDLEKLLEGSLNLGGNEEDLLERVNTLYGKCFAFFFITYTNMQTLLRGKARLVTLYSEDEINTRVPIIAEIQKIFFEHVPGNATFSNAEHRSPVLNRLIEDLMLGNSCPELLKEEVIAAWNNIADEKLQALSSELGKIDIEVRRSLASNFSIILSLLQVDFSGWKKEELSHFIQLIHRLDSALVVPAVEALQNFDYQSLCFLLEEISNERVTVDLVSRLSQMVRDGIFLSNRKHFDVLVKLDPHCNNCLKEAVDVISRLPQESSIGDLVMVVNFLFRFISKSDLPILIAHLNNCSVLVGVGLPDEIKQRSIENINEIVFGNQETPNFKIPESFIDFLGEYDSCFEDFGMTELEIQAWVTIVLNRFPQEFNTPTNRNGIKQLFLSNDLRTFEQRKKWVEIIYQQEFSNFNIKKLPELLFACTIEHDDNRKEILKVVCDYPHASVSSISEMKKMILLVGLENAISYGCPYYDGEKFYELSKHLPSILVKIVRLIENCRDDSKSIQELAISCEWFLSVSRNRMKKDNLVPIYAIVAAVRFFKEDQWSSVLKPIDALFITSQEPDTINAILKDVAEKFPFSDMARIFPFLQDLCLLDLNHAEIIKCIEISLYFPEDFQNALIELIQTCKVMNKGFSIEDDNFNVLILNYNPFYHYFIGNVKNHIEYRLSIADRDPNYPQSLIKIANSTLGYLRQLPLDSKEIMFLEFLQQIQNAGNYLNLEDPSDPFAVYRRLIGFSKVPNPVIDPIAEMQDGSGFWKTNPEGFEALSQSQPRITYGDFQRLPNPDILTELFDAIFFRIQEFSPDQKQQVWDEICELFPDKKDDASGEALLHQLKESFANNEFLKQLVFANTSVDPSVEAPSSVAKFAMILKFILDQGEDVKAGSSLTPRESALLKMALSIQDCNYGREESIAIAYRWLPPEYRLEGVNQGTSAEVQGRAYLHQWIVRVVQDSLSDEGPVLRELTGVKTIEQLGHQAIYLRNAIGKRVGINQPISFDEHSRVLYHKLLGYGLEELLEVFYRHLLPSEMIAALRETVQRDLGKDHRLYGKLNAMIQGGGFTMPANQVWKVDLEASRPTLLTEAGAIALLATMKLIAPETAVEAGN